MVGSDHGDLLGDHELWRKIAMFEGAVSTPLLVRPPGWRAGVDRGGLIDQLDVTASILELAGLEPDGTARGGWRSGSAARRDAPGAQDGKTSVMAEVAAEWSGGFKTAMMQRQSVKLVYDIDTRGSPEPFPTSDPWARGGTTQLGSALSPLRRRPGTAGGTPVPTALQRPGRLVAQRNNGTREVQRVQELADAVDHPTTVAGPNRIQVATACP